MAMAVSCFLCAKGSFHVGCVSIAYVSGGKQVRAVQLEQTRPSPVADDEMKQDEITVHEAGESSRVSVEEGVGNE
jgi:hypothetical protein